MGASKTYKGAVRWGSKVSNRGKESPYTSKPVSKPEGTHMSGENDGLRKGNKGGGNKSKTFSGPKKRTPAASGY